MNISRFDWNEIPDEGQAFYLFSECAAFRRVGNKVVRVFLHPPQHNLVFEDMPTTGAWLSLPPDPPADPFLHWCSLWQHTVSSLLVRKPHPPRKDWIPGNEQINFYGNERYRWYLRGNLLDRYASPEERIIGAFPTLKLAQEAAYEHFMKEIHAQKA